MSDCFNCGGVGYIGPNAAVIDDFVVGCVICPVCNGSGKANYRIFDSGGGNMFHLTLAEQERLDIVQEECAEVIQAISKIKRHGFESGHPDGSTTNRQDLEKELGQLDLAVWMLVKEKDVSEDKILEGFNQKVDSIPPYLHHNKHLFTEKPSYD